MGTRTGKKNMDKATKFAIVNMVEGGVKQVNVASHFGISESTISMIVKKFKSGIVSVIKNRGRRFKLNAAAIRILQCIIVQNNMKPLFVTVNEFKNDYGYNLCIKTVRRYIYKCSISNYAAVPKPYLCPRHILACKR